VALVEQSAYLELSGFHIHAMSHQLQVERHQQLLDGYLQSWPRWRSLVKRPESLRYLNVGGGMGVDYQSFEKFNWSALCEHLQQALERTHNAPIIRFEPGRFVSAYCGYYVMQILDIKCNFGQAFVIARGGTHQFRLPAAQAHDHPVIHLPRLPAQSNSTPSTFTLVGQLCTPKDVLAKNLTLLDPKVGDILMLPLAGAYGYNISHVDFLCHPHPQQIFVGDGFPQE
jgi:diaminopimelate decarboxylase